VKIGGESLAIVLNGFLGELEMDRRVVVLSFNGDDRAVGAGKPQRFQAFFEIGGLDDVFVAYGTLLSSKILLMARYPILGKAEVKLLAGMISMVGKSPPLGGLWSLTSSFGVGRALEWMECSINFLSSPERRCAMDSKKSEASETTSVR
jgi:hypothetical protein